MQGQTPTSRAWFCRSVVRTSKSTPDSISIGRTTPSKLWEARKDGDEGPRGYLCHLGTRVGGGCVP